MKRALRLLPWGIAAILALALAMVLLRPAGDGAVSGNSAVNSSDTSRNANTYPGPTATVGWQAYPTTAPVLAGSDSSYPSLSITDITSEYSYRVSCKEVAEVDFFSNELVGNDCTGMPSYGLGRSDCIEDPNRYSGQIYGYHYLCKR